jgi:perosamine synthetase
MSTSQNRVVPSFRVELSSDEIDEVLSSVEQVMRSGQLILGPYSALFESEFAKSVGADCAVTVNSGSSALEIVARCVGVKDREVLVPVNTNFATAAAVIAAGAKPVFYDGGLFPDLSDIERRLTEQTAMLIVVHVGGYLSPDLSALQDLCRRHGIFFLEDAAHAHYSSIGEKRAGIFGDAAAFSFYPTKVITTGEGGMIVTNDSKLAALSRQFRDQGKDSSGLIHVVMGNSWRITEMGAALGLVQLRSLARDTDYRRGVINYYEQQLRNNPLISFPAEPSDLTTSGYKCIALLRPGFSRKEVTARILDLGVQLGRPVYEVPLHRQPVFQEWVDSAFPIADDFCDRHICLPLWRSIPPEDQQAVVNAFNTLAERWEAA